MCKVHTYIVDNLVNCLQCVIIIIIIISTGISFRKHILAYVLKLVCRGFVAHSEHAEVQEVSASVLLDLPGSDGKMLKCAGGSDIHFIYFMTSIMYQTQG